MPKRTNSTAKPADTLPAEADPDRNADGTWSIANALIWQAGHIKRGGRPRRVDPTSLGEAIAAMTEAGEPLTWAGLALAVGVSRQALDQYHAGDIGDQPTRTYLRSVRTAIEAGLEKQLQRTTGQTGGIVFALKNQAGWRDERHLNVESQEKQQLTITVDPELAGLLESRRGPQSLDIGITLDGEATQVTDSIDETDW